MRRKEQNQLRYQQLDSDEGEIEAVKEEKHEKPHKDAEDSHKWSYLKGKVTEDGAYIPPKERPKHRQAEHVQVDHHAHHHKHRFSDDTGDVGQDSASPAPAPAQGEQQPAGPQGAGGSGDSGDDNSPIYILPLSPIAMGPPTPPAAGGAPASQ